MFISACVFGTRETRKRKTILRGAYRSASITTLQEGARVEAARRLFEVAVRRDTGESSTGAERTEMRGGENTSFNAHSHKTTMISACGRAVEEHRFERARTRQVVYEGSPQAQRTSPCPLYTADME